MNLVEKHKRYNVKLFRRVAPIYDYIEFVVRPLNIKAAKKVWSGNANVLDVACGTGSQALAFAKRGFSVVGIDLSPDMLRCAKKKVRSKYDIKFICHDATKLPFNDSSFDASTISFGLHDMPGRIGRTVLKEMMRATKSGGKIIIVDYHKPKNRVIAWLARRICKTWESKYYDHFLRAGLESYLQKVGLKVVTVERYFFKNFQIVECINLK